VLFLTGQSFIVNETNDLALIGHRIKNFIL
jgi:hypothetical protein